MVFGGNHRLDALAIGKGKDGNLRPGQEFFNDHTVAGSAERFILHDLFHGGLCFRIIRSKDHAFPEGQAVRLNNSRVRAPFPDEIQRLFRIIEHFILRRGNVIFFHQALGKNLAAFDPGRLCIRTERADARFFQLIHHSGGKRIIRCNKDQVSLVLFAKFHNTRNIRRGKRDALRVFRNSPIAGGAVQLRGMRALFQFADNGMLPAAAADYQNLHCVCPPESVVEQAQTGKRHGDAVFVTGLDDIVVADGAARLRNVGHTGLMGTFNVVTEREECVGTQRNAALL